MNQRRFFGNDFSYKKFAYSASVKIRSRRNFVLNIGFGQSPTSVFEVGFVKNQIQKIASWNQLALLATIVLVLKGSQPVNYTDAQT